MRKEPTRFGILAAACLMSVNTANPDVPLCPEKGAAILDDRYPVAAIAISSYLLQQKSLSDVLVPALSQARAKVPLIFTNDPTALEYLRRALPKDHHANLEKVHETSLNHWAQDYSQDFFDSATGLPTIRPKHPNLGQEKPFDKICGAKVAEALTTSSTPHQDAYSGGNIEGLPGGLCLLGDNQLSEKEFSKFAASICEGLENTVEVPTSFLGVGHVDEVVKVVRDHRKKAPCDFSVMVASPEFALKLLETNKDQQAFAEDMPPDKNSKECSVAYWLLKDRHDDQYRNEAPGSPSRSDDSVTKTFSPVPWLRYLLNASAANSLSFEPIEGFVPPPPLPPFEFNCHKDLTNGVLLESLRKEYPELVPRNLEISAKLSTLQETIKKRIRDRLPQCGDPDVAPIPQLFLPEPLTGKTEFKDLRARHLFPPMANSVSIGPSLIIPHPHLAVFKHDMEKKVAERGGEPIFTDTSIASAIGKGNIHCLTNVVRYCRPRGASR